jgi:hypothetical protein
MIETIEVFGFVLSKVVVPYYSSPYRSLTHACRLPDRAANRPANQDTAAFAALSPVVK